MAQIISSGIGSGLDIGGLVSQLVQAERAPQENRLNSNEIRAQSRLSAFGSLKSALSNFQSALSKLQDTETYQQRTATTSNAEVFAITADTEAMAGNYSIQSEALASRHKLASAAYASDETSIGTGTLSFTVNGQSFAVDVHSGSDSLTAIRDAINMAEDNVGISAAIIRDQDGSHLVLTSEESGADYAITVAVSVDGGDTGDLTQLNYDPDGDPLNNNLEQKQAAADAELFVDGFTAKSANNTFSEVIDGVSVTLIQAAPGVSERLDVRLNTNSVQSAISQFVKAYNSLRTGINGLTAYNPETGQAGLLQGDSSVSRLASQLRVSLTDSVSGADEALNTLAEIGITTDVETGTLVIDSTKLKDLVNSNFEDFVSLFAGDDGIAARLDAVADVYTQFEGILDTRSNGLKQQIERISEQRVALERRIASIEERYLSQFTALDTLLGELNQTSSFLTNQLSNLPGFTRDKK